MNLNKLSVKKSIFAENILAGKTIKEAAALVGVSNVRAHDWLNAGLRSYINDVRKQVFESAMNQLEGVMQKAVGTLDALMNEGTPPPQRLGAARCVIEQAAKLYELRDIEQRLCNLESNISIGKPSLPEDAYK